MLSRIRKLDDTTKALIFTICEMIGTVVLILANGGLKGEI